MPTLDWQRRTERLLKRISESEVISDNNKRLLRNFCRELKVKDYSPARTSKLLNHMVRICEALPDIDLERASREDIMRIVEWVQDQDFSAETKKDYRIALRVFYKWLDCGSVKAREVPERVKDLSTTVKRSEQRLPDELLTEDDVKSMIRHATNPRTRCLIAMLWETGGRMGEIIDLKVKDIKPWRYGYQVVLNGKTGSRRVPLILSEPYINEWLDMHPMKDSEGWPGVWLWVDVKLQNHNGRKKRAGDRADYHALVRDIQRAARRAGIKKPVNPHNFRHSRATFMANHFTEAQMNQWFGWVPGSRMPARYVHLSGRDIDKAYAILHGIESVEEQRPKFIPKKCSRCDLEKIAPDSKFCPRCGAPLDAETLVEIEEAERRVVDALAKLKDVDIMKFLEFAAAVSDLMGRDPYVAKKLEEVVSR